MACSSPTSLILYKDKDNDLSYKEALLNFFENCDSSLCNKTWLSDSHSLSNFKSSVDILYFQECPVRPTGFGFDITVGALFTKIFPS